MNIRELDEESRRTGVWPPRRIILRVEREADGTEVPVEAPPAPVKVAEVDLAAPRPASAPAAAKQTPAPPAPSLSPSVTPSRRPGVPGSRGVTPASVSREEAEFEEWVARPLANADSEPKYQAPPVWLPDDVRVHAERRQRRVARKARTQLFGASAATTLAAGGCVAVFAIVGLSQTDSVGGALGAPSIGLFGSVSEPASTNETPDAAPAKPAARKATTRANRPASARRARRAAPAPRASRDAAASAPARTSAPSSSRDRPSVARRPQASTPPPRASSPPPRASNPPPPPPSPPPPPRQSAPVVWDAPSQPATSAPAPSRPANNTAPSRPAPSGAPPTTSSPAP